MASPLLRTCTCTSSTRRWQRLVCPDTAYGDDWVITCRRAEAERALASAAQCWKANSDYEFTLRRASSTSRRALSFLGYKIRGQERMVHREGGPDLYAYPRPTERSSASRTGSVTLPTRRNPKPLGGLLDELNPVIRGWGNYYRRAHVRRLFNRLNGWIVRRIWSWRYKRWRCRGYRKLPREKLYGELGLVNLLQVIPSMDGYYRQKGYSR